MKIAVYITGALKAFEHCYESINNCLILPNNADTYISVWDRLGVDENHLKIKKEELKLKDRTIRQTDLALFKKIRDYHITYWKQDYYKKYNGVVCPDSVIKKNPIHYYSTIPVSYQNYRCCNFDKDDEYYTANDGTYYDYIIKIRPDLKFRNEFVVKKEKFDPKYLHSCSYRINKTTQVSDKFVLGGLNVMRYYCSLFPNLNKYWNKTDLVGEKLLKYHFDNSKFDVKYFSAPVKIIRENLK